MSWASAMSETEYGRRVNDRIDERRQGPSRLSRWNGRHIVIAWVAWAGCLLLLLALGAAASVAGFHSLIEARIAFSRSNIMGLLGVFVVPPGCLTAEWWIMRGRRQQDPERRSHSL